MIFLEVAWRSVSHVGWWRSTIRFIHIHAAIFWVPPTSVWNFRFEKASQNPQHEGSLNGVHQGSLYDIINPKQCICMKGNQSKNVTIGFVWSLIDPSPTLGSQWNDPCRPREAILMGWIHWPLRMPKGWQPGNLPVNVSTLWAKAPDFWMPGNGLLLLKGYLRVHQV